MQNFMDFLNNPMVAMAAGLLDPSGTYGSFGSSLNKGLLAGQQAMSAGQTNQLQQLQIQAYKRKLEEDKRKQALLKQFRDSDFSGLLGQKATPDTPFEQDLFPGEAPIPGLVGKQGTPATGMRATSPETAMLIEKYMQMDPEAGMSAMMTQALKPPTYDHLMEVDDRLYDARSGRWITPPGGGGVGGWTLDAMRKEFNYGEYTPESVKAAEAARDPSLFVPQRAPMSFGDIEGARKSFESDYRKTYRKIATSAGQLKNLILRGGGIADVGAMVAFVKSLDPESVVRESEVRVTQAATGIYNRLDVLLQQLGPKGAGMNDAIRRQMLAATDDLLREYKQSYEFDTAPWRERAERWSVPVSDILGADIVFPNMFSNLPDNLKDAGVPRNVENAASAGIDALREEQERRRRNMGGAL